MKLAHLFIILLSFTMACQNLAQDNKSSSSPEFVKNQEAREDSIKLAEAYALQSNVTDAVTASFQTDHVDEMVDEDAADDPAFWFNESKPEASVIYGSNKKGGIYAYDLSGSTLNYYEVGDVNNIDVRTKVNIGQESYDLIGGSNRTYNSIYLMAIDSVGALSDLGSLAIDTSFIDEVYGFCLAKTDGQTLAVVNGKNGRIAAYSIESEENQVKFELAYQWKLNTQPEGMVVDDANQMLYVGEEELGIWKIALREDATPSLIASSTAKNNDRISYDIEGLSLYQMENPWHESGVLVASIQGSFSYAVFDLSERNSYLGSFKIVDSPNIDGVEETDGLEVANYAISETYPKGILIVQDGFNLESEEAASQNFKIIDMQSILKLWNNPPASAN